MAHTPIEIVNEQAKDESLWFVAEHAPEAYLQQALRVLHDAVETFGSETARQRDQLLEAIDVTVRSLYTFAASLPDADYRSLKKIYQDLDAATATEPQPTEAKA